MEHMRPDTDLNECDFIELKQQSGQHPSNICANDVISARKEILFNPSECQIHFNKKYSNNSICFAQNIGKISRRDMHKFIKKPLPTNKICNDCWSFQQSCHKVLNLLKYILKWRYLYYLLLFSVILSVLIGIVAYGIWVHNVNEKQQHNSISNIKLIISRAHLNTITLSNNENKNSTDTTIKNTTGSQRLMTNDSVFAISTEVFQKTNVFNYM